MARFSGTALATKLGIKEGSRLTLLSVPEDLALELPPHVTVQWQARAKADNVVAFFSDQSSLTQRVANLSKTIFPWGGLWIAWPKKSSGVETDLTDHAVRDTVLPLGLVDNKVCAIDETWSALRFVWRLEHRGSGTDGSAS